MEEQLLFKNIISLHSTALLYFLLEPIVVVASRNHMMDRKKKEVVH